MNEIANRKDLLRATLLVCSVVYSKNRTSEMSFAAGMSDNTAMRSNFYKYGHINNS